VIRVVFYSGGVVHGVHTVLSAWCMCFTWCIYSDAQARWCYIVIRGVFHNGGEVQRFMHCGVNIFKYYI
jgi:hypothetical protein